MANQSSFSALSMHRDSRSISKIKPAIRIIHIFAPEIIKTDVENFRDLVQRLTGKPAGDQKALHRMRKLRTVRKAGPRRVEDTFELSPSSLFESRRMVVKREELGMWNAESSGGFLNGFEHLDGYVQELVEFPFLPVDHHHHHHHHQASNSSSSSQSTMHGFEL